MRYLTLALTILLFSCQKANDSNGSTTGGGSGGTGGTGTVTLGTQKELFGSTVHTYKGSLESNNDRLFFAAQRNTSVDEYYVSDGNDSVYKLQQFSSGSVNMSYDRAGFCLKANGDIIAIFNKTGYPPADSILTLINKKGTNYWQVLKREIKNSFWTDYTYSNYYRASIYTTPTGRLVLIGYLKVAVSDDNGINWRYTFNTTWAGGVEDQSPLSTIGTRNFVYTADGILYSDNDFETGTYKLIDYGAFCKQKIIKLDDGRLLMNTSFGVYQSTNNGISWSHYTYKDPTDSIKDYDDSYFAFVSGNNFRIRAKYSGCVGSYMTVEINPTSFFKFYPMPRIPCSYTYFGGEEYNTSCQSPDKRTYYAISKYIGTVPYFGIYRDY